MLRALQRGAAVVLLLALLTGCWDMKEINEQSYIIGLGLDAGGREGEYIFTFQKAVPVGMDGSADSGSIKYENITVSAPSIADAVRRMTLASSSEFSFEHLSCVVVGHELAHSGFSHLLEYLLQQSDVRRQCIVAVASDSAARLLGSTPLASSSSLGTASMLEELDRSRGHSVVMTLGAVSIAVLTGRGFCLYAVGESREITAAAPDVSPSDAAPALAVTGAYVFSPHELTGTLAAEQADILRLFAKTQNDGMISAAHESGRTVYFWIDRSSCTISCEIVDDRLVYDIDVAGWCSIADTSGLPADEIELSLLEGTLHSRLSELITLSQQRLGGAFLGLEDAARQSDSRWYSEHRTNFSEYYRDAVISLEVDCQLEKSGVIN